MFSSGRRENKFLWNGRSKWSDLRTLHVRGYEGHALHACVGVHVVAYISGQNSHFDLCVDKQNRTSTHPPTHLHVDNLWPIIGKLANAKHG